MDKSELNDVVKFQICETPTNFFNIKNNYLNTYINNETQLNCVQYCNSLKGKELNCDNMMKSGCQADVHPSFYLIIFNYIII